MQLTGATVATSPYAIAPNRALQTVNVYAIDLGAPALASANRIVASTAMAVGTYTIANATSADSLPRNVTVTSTATSTADTQGTVTITGTNVEGTTITEDIVPVTATTVAGNKAFATVTSVTHAGWVVNTGADLITVGFGNKVGLPANIDNGPFAYTGTAEIITLLLGGVAIAPNATYSSSDISQDTVDGSAGTYNGTKRMVALLLRA